MYPDNSVVTALVLDRGIRVLIIGLIVISVPTILRRSDTTNGVSTDASCHNNGRERYTSE